jgi:copper(I)-binding protein
MRTINRPSRGSSVGCALMLAVAVGCGTDAEIGSSARGASGEDQATSIDNAYIVPSFVPGSCALQEGRTAQLRFTITNGRPLKEERLLTVNTDAADRITVPRDVTVDIAAGESLSAGEPDGASGAPPAVQLVGLRPSVRPATSVPVTFGFKESGNTTVQVPIEACPVQK